MGRVWKVSSYTWLKKCMNFQSFMNVLWNSTYHNSLCMQRTSLWYFKWSAMRRNLTFYIAWTTIVNELTQSVLEKYPTITFFFFNGVGTNHRNCWINISFYHFMRENILITLEAKILPCERQRYNGMSSTFQQCSPLHMFQICRRIALKEPRYEYIMLFFAGHLTDWDMLNTIKPWIARNEQHPYSQWKMRAYESLVPVKEARIV